MCGISHSVYCFIFAMSCAWSFQILKLQETSKFYSSMYDLYSLSSISTGLTSSNQYGFSTWSRMTISFSSWHDILRVSENTATSSYNGRLLLFQIYPSLPGCFHSGMTEDPSGVGYWGSFANGVPTSQLFPLNQWIFIVLATDISANNQQGFTYNLSSSTTTRMNHKNRSAEGSFYTISQSGVVYVGGSNFSGSHCSCYLQYARIYIDYFPSSVDEMINLAIMDTGIKVIAQFSSNDPIQGNLYILYFESDPTINNNSTIPVLTVGTDTNSTTTASKDTMAVPQLGAYNTLNCIGTSMLSLNTGVSSINGMVIAMDIMPLDAITSDQTIFSIRDNSTNIVPIVFAFQPPSSTNLITNYGSGQNAPIAGPALTLNAWNRLVVEIVQAQPTSFGLGFSTFRAWVNGTGGMSRIPIGDFSSNQIPFPSMTDATLDLCASKTYGTSNNEAGFGGDILNLLWYEGAEGLYVNSSDPSCALSGFLDPNQRACLQCNNGYYFYDMTCLNSCPSDTYTHENIKSCLECHMPEEYFDTNGFCTPCSHTGQILIQGTCYQCDASCLNCSGSQTTCTSCASQKYLTNSATCDDCDTTCTNCNGPERWQCTSCTLPTVLIDEYCLICPPTSPIDFSIQASKTGVVYPCETLNILLSDVTNNQSSYNIIWTVTSSISNTTNEMDIASLLNAGAGGISSLPPMTLLYGTTYVLSANLSDLCSSTTMNVTIQTAAAYPTSQRTNPAATFLSWWENNGTLLGCSNCSNESSSSVPTCSVCSSPLQLTSGGSCFCSDPRIYIDLGNFPFGVSCKNKENSLVSWSSQQKTPTIQMQTNFSNDFLSFLPNLNYTASSIAVETTNRSFTIQDYSASVGNSTSPNITLSFTISQDIGAGVQIEITNLSQYNQISFSPFLIQNPNLTYTLPAVTYLSPTALKTITLVGNTANAVMQAQALCSSIIPAVTGGLSTSAILLVDFLAEVDLYKYINVPFPDNFVVFCQNISASVLPNIFAGIDVVNGGNNPNSTIGKFQFWGVSATMLDNSYSSIFKELIILGIIVGSSILIVVFRKCPDLRLIFWRVRSLFMWNMFLSFYLGDFSELQLNSMIQMRENYYVSSSYANLSLLFAVLVVTTYALLMGYMLFKLVRKESKSLEIQKKHLVDEPKIQDLKDRETLQSNKNNKDAAADIKSKTEWVEAPKTVRILIEDFKRDNRFTRSFMLTMLLQSQLIIFLVFFFQDYGRFQAIVYIQTTIIYVCLIVWHRPFKSKVQTGILLFNQATKIAMGMIAIILGSNDRTQSVSPAVVSQMGYTLIILVVTTIGINLVISILIMLVSGYKGVKKVIWVLRNRHKNYQKPNEKKDNVGNPEENNSMFNQNQSSSQIAMRDTQNGSNLQDSRCLEIEPSTENISHSVLSQCFEPQNIKQSSSSTSTGSEIPKSSAFSYKDTISSYIQKRRGLTN